MASEGFPHEKSPHAGEQYETTEQPLAIERVATVDVDNYQGLTVKCVVVYLVRGVGILHDAFR